MRSRAERLVATASGPANGADGLDGHGHAMALGRVDDEPSAALGVELVAAVADADVHSVAAGTASL